MFSIFDILLDLGIKKTIDFFFSRPYEPTLVDIKFDNPLQYPDILSAFVPRTISRGLAEHDTIRQSGAAAYAVVRGTRGGDAGRVSNSVHNK